MRNYVHVHIAGQDKPGKISRASLNRASLNRITHLSVINGFIWGGIHLPCEHFFPKFGLGLEWF